MKPGISYISERTKQFRYVDDNEQAHFLTQCSEYRVAKSVKRGMPVSIYSVSEMERDLKELKESLKITTDPSASSVSIAKDFFKTIKEGDDIELTVQENYLDERLSSDIWIFTGESSDEPSSYLLKRTFTLKEGDDSQTKTAKYYIFEKEERITAHIPSIDESPSKIFDFKIMSSSYADVSLEYLFEGRKKFYLLDGWTAESDTTENLTPEEKQARQTLIERKIAWTEKVIRSNESYVVPSNIWRHDKVVGLALEPCIIDYEADEPSAKNPIHIQSTGTFYYDLPGNTNFTGKEFEYYPTDVSENFTYKKAVGQALYVKGDLDIEDSINGEVSILEEDTLLGFDKTIHLGYVTDAPDNYIENAQSDNVIKVELQLNGDVRGPINHTQFFLTVGDRFSVPAEDQIRVFAIGQEDPSKFSFKVAYDSNETIYNNTAAISPLQFFGIRRLDGKTAIVTFDRNRHLTATSISTTISNKEGYEIDKNYFNTSKHYGKIVDELFTFTPDFTNPEQFRTSLHEAFSNAFAAVAEPSFSMDKANEHAAVVTHNPTSLVRVVDQLPERSLTNDSFTLFLEADDFSGYYEFYISERMKDLFIYSEQISTGSVYNKGYAVIADNRIPERMNLIGLYNGRKWGKTYNPGDQCLFIKQGIYELSWQQRPENKLIPGEQYYLGHNGRITNAPGKYATHLASVGLASYNDTIIVDATKSYVTNNGDLPVGHIKPSVNGHAEYGYILADGKTRYDVERYKDLLERLKGWYPEKALDIKDGTFIVPCITFTSSENPDDFDNSLSYVTGQIKWLVEGIYDKIPYEPFERFFGTFDESSNIDVCDLTSLVSYGPVEEHISTNSAEFFDIRLYVDLNPDHGAEDFEGPYDWTEIKEGLFTFNNTTTYGFRWRIENDGSRFILRADLMGSNGIAFESVHDSPPTLLNGLAYKVWVYRREMYPRPFDLSGVVNTLITDTVVQNRLAPTNKAIIKYINDSVNTKELSAGESLKLVSKDGIISIKNDDVTILTANVDGLYYGEAVEDNKAVKYSTMKDHVNTSAYNDNSSNLGAEESWNLIVGTSQNQDEEQFIKKGAHGDVHGFDGNIHAASVQGFFVKKFDDASNTTIRVNGFVENEHKSHIPFVEYIAAGNDILDLRTDSTEEAPLMIKTRSGDIEISKDDSGTVLTVDTINATVNTQSTIKLKKLFFEDIHSFNDLDINADIVIGDTNYGHGLDMSTYIGSAMQAIYELPLAVFKYNNQVTSEDETADENNKPFVGVIIERLKAVKDVLEGITSEETDFTREYWENKEYHYTQEEAKSIAKYINLLTDNRDASVNIMTSVGTLLAAAKETQERLLAVEASTFGEDYDHIPGNRTKPATMPEGVNANPTVLGLNRLVRALCQEIFLTADPGQIISGGGDHATALSRVDALDQQINGSAAYNDKNNDDEVTRISLNRELGATYPVSQEIPVDGNYLENGTTAAEFDGLNNAVNRIVIKLNALTESVHGRNNINSKPVRLDTIRSNISRIIKENWWSDYSDDVLVDGTNDVFDADTKKSRIDRITEELYQYSVKYGKYIGESKKAAISGGVLDERKYFTLTVPSDSVDNDDGAGQNGLDSYNNWSIIDVILDTIGAEEIIRREFNPHNNEFSELIWNPNDNFNNAEDSQRTEFEHYIDVEKNDITKVKTVRTRINKKILTRLLTIELALDKLSNWLTGDMSSFETASNAIDGGLKSINDFLLKMKEWSGVEFKDGDWFYKGSNEQINNKLAKSINSYISKYEQDWDALIKATSSYINLNRAASGEAKTVEMYDDIYDLIRTIYHYDEDDSEKNIIHRSLIEDGGVDKANRFIYYTEHERANIIEKIAEHLHKSYNSTIDETDNTKYVIFDENKVNPTNVLTENRKKIFTGLEGSYETRLDQIEFVLRQLRTFIGQSQFKNHSADVISNIYGNRIEYNPLNRTVNGVSVATVHNDNSILSMILREISDRQTLEESFKNRNKINANKRNKDVIYSLTSSTSNATNIVDLGNLQNGALFTNMTIFDNGVVNEDDIEGEIISSSEIVTKANDNNIKYIKLDETSADIIGMDYLIIPADGETFYHADIKTFEEIDEEIEADMRDFGNYEDENNVIEPAETKFFKNKDVKPRTYISSYAAENIQIELNVGSFIGKTLKWSIRNE